MLRVLVVLLRNDELDLVFLLKPCEEGLVVEDAVSIIDLDSVGDELVLRYLAGLGGESDGGFVISSVFIVFFIGVIGVILIDGCEL